MATEKKFQIFRAKDAQDFMDTKLQTMKPFTDVQKTGMEKLVNAGALDGSVLDVLVNIPGFSLLHIWFKENFPLLLHSHDVDCLYYIVAGSIDLGTETLGPRDSFFVPADVPYTYNAGPQGVELLEIRQTGAWDFKNHAKGEAFYEKAAAICAANRETWKNTTRPSQRTAN